MTILRWAPTGGVGLNNFDKHAINARLTPAVAAAAVKLGVPLLDTRPAFGGCPACLKRPLSGVPARPHPGSGLLYTQRSRGRASRSDHHEGLWCHRQRTPKLELSHSQRPGCPANVSACCALLARDGLHTTTAGAVAVARMVHAWVRAPAS
jgi:lysophospholipase L1-like esterase